MTDPAMALARPGADLLALTALCLPAVPPGIWVGWRLHRCLNRRQLHRACHGLLVVTALKLLWDGVGGDVR